MPAFRITASLAAKAPRSNGSFEIKNALVSFVQQKERSAALCKSMFDQAPFDDVASRVYDPSAMPTVQPTVPNPPERQERGNDTYLMLPETEDPMVAFVAASVDMQQRQADLLAASVRAAEKQRKDMQEMMRQSIQLADDYQNRHMAVFRSQMKRRQAEELEAFQVFGAQQRKYIKASLDDHSKAEKSRLQAFRHAHDTASKKKIKNQADKFSTSISRVTDTLNQHQSGISALLKSLKQQQDISRALKNAIDRKVSPALSPANGDTIRAISAVGHKLRQETSKGTNAVVQAVSTSNKSQTDEMCKTLQEHGKNQKKMIESTFNEQQKKQIKGLSAAVMNQKQKQAQQLNQLRSALEARRQAMSLPTSTKSVGHLVSTPFPTSLNHDLKRSESTSQRSSSSVRNQQ